MKLWLKDDLDSKKTLIQRAMLFSVVTLLVLFLFQPFGTHSDTISYKFLRLSGYGLVTFCGVLLAGFIEILLSRRRLNSLIRKGLIATSYIGLVAVFNHSYFVVAVLGAWHWQNQLLFVFYTLAIGLFPISFMFIVNRHADNIKATQHEKIASKHAEMNKGLGGGEVTETQRITLTGENKIDHIQIALTQLLFVKSADNYCELSILENHHVSQKLLRCSITNLLKQLPDNSVIYRCHRSYAVNLSLVTASTGNAAGLQLSLPAVETMVPVSRTYVDVIKQALLLVPKAC